MGQTLLEEAERLLSSGKLYPLDKSLLKSAVERARAGDMSQLPDRLARVQQKVAAQDARNAVETEAKRKRDAHQVRTILAKYRTEKRIRQAIARVEKDLRKNDQQLPFGDAADSFGGLVEYRNRLQDAIVLLSGADEELRDYYKAI
jgi:hypothetical protein